MTETGSDGIGRYTLATGMLYVLAAIIFATVSYLGLVGADDYARASGMALAVVVIGLVAGAVIMLIALTSPPEDSE